MGSLRRALSVLKFQTMTKQLPAPTVPEQTIEPVSTAAITLQEQAARTQALKRHNWLVLYLPLIVGTLLAVGFFGVLAWFALAGEAGSAERAQSSGIADVFITMICLAPLAVFGAAFAGGGLFLLYWRRQKGSLLRERMQGVMRGVDGRLNSADDRARVEQARVIEHTVKYRTKFEAFLDKLSYQAAHLANRIHEQLARNRDKD